VLSRVAKLLDGVGPVLYQAGADIHVNDPLGGLLTTAEMRERDARIFAACLKHKVPCVWNLAGGYAKDKAGTIEPVLKLYRQTMAACIKESREHWKAG
jgi:acetoin utilization deacetylase AcuC-like enzyme